MGIVAAISDLLFPPKCIFCRRTRSGGSRAACADCLRDLTAGPIWRSGTWFTKCPVPMVYDDRVREAVIRFKFQDKPGYATEFGRILADCIRENLSGEYDLITWIPVSQERLTERGYDQSMLLAMAAALELQDVAVETLRKTADTPAQSGIQDPAARRQNIQSAYDVPDPELITRKRVLVIDDIITTGATLDEAARTLLVSGASQVLAAALATPKKSTTNC